MDLPEVIELRRKLIGGEGVRYHFLAGSVLDSAWLETVSVHCQRPFLFLAEAVILKGREFDRFAQDFLARHPDAVVVHIGCGLDTRFERVCSEQSDNGQVEWYDLDLPDVIELRRKFIGVEGGRYHLLGCSVLEDAWLDTVSAHRQRPFLFLAEGVFMYFKEAQVKSLVLTLRDHFPGAELVFDAFSPFNSAFCSCTWSAISCLAWRSTRCCSKRPEPRRMHWSRWGICLRRPLRRIARCLHCRRARLNLTVSAWMCSRPMARRNLVFCSGEDK